MKEQVEVIDLTYSQGYYFFNKKTDVVIKTQHCEPEDVTMTLPAGYWKIEEREGFEPGLWALSIRRM